MKLTLFVILITTGIAMCQIITEENQKHPTVKLVATTQVANLAERIELVLTIENKTNSDWDYDWSGALNYGFRIEAICIGGPELQDVNPVMKDRKYTSILIKKGECQKLAFNLNRIKKISVGDIRVKMNMGFTKLDTQGRSTGESLKVSSNSVDLSVVDPELRAYPKATTNPSR